MDRKKKEDLVYALKEKFSRARMVVLTNFQGLNVAKMSELRRQLREVEGEYKVAKNTLILRATEETPAKVLEKYFRGPNGLAFAYDDVVSVAKVLSNFAKENEVFEIKGGLLEENELTKEQIIELAKLPSREVLLAKLLGCLQAVPGGFVRVLNGILLNFIWVLKAIEEKKKEAAS